MAEFGAFAIASKVVSMIDSSLFKKCLPIGEVTDEIEKMSVDIQGIQDLILDAEKKAASAWLRRVRDVLYEADDLLDEVATDQMLQTQMMKGNNPLEEVRFDLSKSNLFISSASLSERVEAIRKNLDQISEDAAQFGLVESLYEEPVGSLRKGVGIGWLVDRDVVIGRDDDLEAMNVGLIHKSKGLSSNASWELFTRIAFTREQLNDPNWHILGRRILKECADVPLVIKSTASLLYTKTTKEEWKSFLDKQIEASKASGDDSIMSKLKLCYDDLPSNLKQCFAYCSLFPKNYRFGKQQLIRLWIAQGFVRPKSEYNCEGEAGFKELLRRSFFQCEKGYENDEIFSCKMQNLFHDLAIDVAQNESMMLTHTGGNAHNTIRHLSIGYKTDDSWKTLPPLLGANRLLRSFLFIDGGSLKTLDLQQLTSHRFLRAMDLQNLNIVVVPSSIGELKHLRYLNLSRNKFTYLPESITKLVNLLTFEVNFCNRLEALPTNFSKLINLRHLSNEGCYRLRHMPPALEELSNLQHLSSFKVGKSIGGIRSSRLDALARLQLKENLEILFDIYIDEWDEDECWRIPTTLQVLHIRKYPGVRMPRQWSEWRSVNPSLLPKLVKLMLYNSSTIKHLPPLRCLPFLKALYLSFLDQLEYIEAEQDGNESGQSAQVVADCTMLFFPCLEDLRLLNVPKLKAWSREVEGATRSKGEPVKEELSSCTDLPLYQMPSFPRLSTLDINNCPLIKSMPLSQRLKKLSLKKPRGELIQQVLSLCFHSLETIWITTCDSSNSFKGETLTSLQHLELREVGLS